MSRPHAGSATKPRLLRSFGGASGSLGQIAPFILLALLLVVLFHGMLAGGRVPVAADVLRLSLPWARPGEVPVVGNWYVADSIYLFYPWQRYFVDELRQGRLALWNPYSFAGHPLLANSQSGFLDPFNVVFLLFEFNTAYGLRSLLHLYAAGVFAYLYLRHGLRCTLASALLGGVVYMLNGVFIAWLEWRWMVAGALWVPLLFLLLEASWRRRSMVHAALAAIPLAGSLLAGMIQQSLAIMVALVLYTAVRGPRRADGRGGVLLWPWMHTALAGVLAVGIAAVQLVPTLELMLYSQRDLDLIRHTGEWLRAFPRNFLLSVALLVTFLNPYWAGNPLSLDLRTLITWPTFHGNIVEYQGYAGILPLVLAGLAAAGRRDRYVRAFLWFGSAILFLSLATPLNLVLYYRALFLYVFAVAALAALGLEHVVSRGPNTAALAKLTRFLLVVIGVYGGLVAVGNVLLMYTGEAIRQFGRRYLQGHITNYLAYTNSIDYVYGRLDALIDSVRFTSPTIYVPLALVGVIVLTLTLYRWQVLGNGGFQVACLAIVGVELLYVGLTFVPQVRPEEVFPRTDVTEFLRRDRSVFRVLPVRLDIETDPPIVPPNTHLVYAIPSIVGYDSLFPRRFAEFARLVDSRGVLSPHERFSVAARFSRYDDRLLDLVNVKYVLTGPDQEITSPKFTKVFQGSVRVYENRAAFPRAFVVLRSRIVPRREDLMRALLSPGFDPSSEVLLEDGPALTPVVSGEGGEVEILSYDSRRILVQARVPREGFLVLSDMYFPGWRAQVNGRVLPILRANYMMRAVALPPGTSRIEFTYAPRSFAAGRAISLTAAGLLVAAAASGVVRRRNLREIRTPHSSG